MRKAPCTDIFEIKEGYPTCFFFRLDKSFSSIFFEMGGASLSNFSSLNGLFHDIFYSGGGGVLLPNFFQMVKAP